LKNESTTSLFPNPSKAPQLNFKNSFSEKVISVSDQLGKIISITYVPANEVSVRLNEITYLSNGVYFISVKADGIVETLKWLKQ
jgi:hypothetical protein